MEVRFKGNRKAFFSWEEDTSLAVGSPVVVEVERGRDLGRISAVGEAAERRCGVGCEGCTQAAPKETQGKVLRPATPEDTHLTDELRKAEDDVRRTVIERVATHKLDMKVTDAEWQWDRRSSRSISRPRNESISGRWYVIWPACSAPESSCGKSEPATKQNDWTGWAGAEDSIVAPHGFQSSSP